MTETITARLATLPKMRTRELKAMWFELFKRPPPDFNRSYLLSRLAYKVQELHFGGLKPTTRAKLDRLADGLDPKQVRKRGPARLLAGTRLCREWQGVEHTVTTLADGGFDYAGRRFASLSAVARAITGTRWNGPLFFGLRSKGRC